MSPGFFFGRNVRPRRVGGLVPLLFGADPSLSLSEARVRSILSAHFPLGRPNRSRFGYDLFGRSLCVKFRFESFGLVAQGPWRLFRRERPYCCLVNSPPPSSVLRPKAASGRCPVV